MTGEPKFPPPSPDSLSGMAVDIHAEQEPVDIEKLNEKWTEEDIRMLEPLSIHVHEKIAVYTRAKDRELKRIIKKLHPDYSDIDIYNALLQFIVANSMIARPSSVQPENLPTVSPKEYARILIEVSKKI